jgi:hypothetical protein
MISDMLRKMGFGALLLSAGLLAGCGISSWGPDGSRHQTMTGVSGSGYPGGQPADAESPALGSSPEQKYSRDASEEPAK